MFGGMPWQIYFQRALACKTPRKAQIVSFVASLCCLLMPIPAVLIGAVGVKTGKVRSECSLGQIRTLLVRPFVQRSFIKIKLNSVRRPQNAGRYKWIFLLSVSGHHSKQARMVNGRVCFFRFEELETRKNAAEDKVSRLVRSAIVA